MDPIAFPGIVTGLAVLLYSLFTMNSGRNRGKHKVMAPAVTGSEAYERANRVQMNTLEHLAIFLPGMWLYGYSLSYRVAAAIGLAWIVGRLVYGVAYLRDPASRGPGMIVTLLTEIWLLLGGLYGFAMLLFRA